MFGLGFVWWPLREASPFHYDGKAERWVRCVIEISKKKSTNKSWCFPFGDPYGNRTHVTTVKGWCLNRLTKGPWCGCLPEQVHLSMKRTTPCVVVVAAVRFEPTTCRVWTGRSNQLSYAATTRGCGGGIWTTRPPGYEPDELPNCSTPRQCPIRIYY